MTSDLLPVTYDLIHELRINGRGLDAENHLKTRNDLRAKQKEEDNRSIGIALRKKERLVRRNSGMCEMLYCFNEGTITTVKGCLRCQSCYERLLMYKAAR